MAGEHKNQSLGRQKNENKGGHDSATSFFRFCREDKQASQRQNPDEVPASGEEKAEQVRRDKEKERKSKLKEAKTVMAKALLSYDLGLEVEFIRPRSDENQRLVNQNGLFSRAPNGVDLDDWITKNFSGDESGYTLMKLQIPNVDRTDCLRTLNRMNINHLTLFPDLYGASKYCNIHGEISHY